MRGRERGAEHALIYQEAVGIFFVGDAGLDFD